MSLSAVRHSSRVLWGSQVGTKVQLFRWRYKGKERTWEQDMKRLIIFLGLAWALIYLANHTVFVRATSETEVKATTAQTTDRQVDSWGPYLPNVRPPLPDEQPAGSPSHPRQPREFAARQIEADPAFTSRTSHGRERKTSDVGPSARGENASTEESIVKKSKAASPKAKTAASTKPKKSHRPATSGQVLSQVSASQRSEPPRHRRGVGLFMFAPPGF